MAFTKKTVRDVDVDGKRVLMRVDFNVPLKDGVVTDDTRVRAAIPTIKYLKEQGAGIILMSHLGRPKGDGPEPELSLRPAAEKLAELTGYDVRFVDDTYGEKAEKAVSEVKPGDILVLENVRFLKAEKKNDPEVAKKLASYGDIFVLDAFGTAHRAHASTALMADCFDADHKMFGYLMEKEVRAVEKVLNDINRPFTAIMGGSKVSSKIEIIENLLGKVDNLIICGGMTYTFMKALGGKIGSSICQDDKLDLALSLIEKAKARGVKLVLSSDSKIADRFSNDANTAIAPNNNIPDGWQGLDIGPETEREFADVIRSSKTILWNGPTGVFEFDNFSHGSRVVAEAIVEATKAGAYSLVGGGDSVACINKFGLADGVSYVSTGGGALLEAIEGKVLPGIKAIRGY